MRLLPACFLIAAGFAQAQAPVASSPIAETAIATAKQLRDSALAGSGAYAITESLTTEVGARMAGSEADARAVRWAEAKFKALGFDRVTLEPVTIPVWRRGREHAEVVSPAPQKLALLALGWSSGTPKGGIEAEIVRFANIDALKAAPDSAVKGRIVYVSQKMQRRRDGGGYGVAVGARGFVRVAVGEVVGPLDARDSPTRPFPIVSNQQQRHVTHRRTRFHEPFDTATRSHELLKVFHIGAVCGTY